jgi:CBS domain-containing protein
MAETGSEVIAITEGGAVGARLHGLLTASDLVVSFGDQPAVLFREIAHAANPAELRGLQQRAREFILSQLSSPAALDWLARLAYLADAGILARIVAWNPPPAGEFCLCFYGAAGREESLAPVLPETVVIPADASRQPDFAAWHRNVQETLAGCGYVTPAAPFDAAFSCAGIAEWKDRFRGWVQDPVLTEVYHARPLFDLRPVPPPGNVQEQQPLWRQLASAVGDLIRAEPDFLPLLANDCLGNLPPLTFFRDLVIGESGEESSVFQLEQSALRPLVDVGRVFGLAAGQMLGSSTFERLSLAKRMLPEQAVAFREAAETLRVVLTLQARVGIRQHSSGFELPPALLSHHDRQVLKSGFRSILRLLEFTENYTWPEAE